MKTDQNRQGEIFIFFEAVLWGLFPIITIFSLSGLNPLVSLAWSTLFSVLFFALVLIKRGKWEEIKRKEAYKDILFSTFFLGVLYYSLVFFGLNYTSAGNAAIVALTEVFFSFIFFHLLRKDYISSWHISGAVLMLVGALVVLSPNLSNFKTGDALILLAAAIAPFGNFFQQRARKLVSSETLLFVRSLITSVFLFLFSLIFYTKKISFGSGRTLLFLAINGLFLLGLSKIFWVEGIHRISVVKANALSSISPFMTLVFAWLFLHNIPTVWQISSLIPMFVGLLLLSYNKKKELISV